MIAIKYESGNLLFELDQPINADWFQIIVSDTYSHTAMMGYETKRLQKLGKNMLAMPIRLNESQGTIRNVVKYVKEWVCTTNGIYKTVVLRQVEREQRAEEQRRLEKIKQLEKENEMRDFLSSLQ